MRAITISILLSLVGACGGPSVEPPAAEPVAVEGPLRAALRPGDVHRYDFAWTVSSEGGGGGLGEIPVQGDVELRGELAVRVYEERPEGVLVGVRFTRLDVHRLAVLGQNVLPEPDPLLHDEAIMVVPADARPREVFFSATATPVFRQLASGLLAHVDVVVPRAGAQAWTEVGPTGNGLAELAYARDDADTITRKVGPYRRVDALAGAPADASWAVDGEATIALGRDALVESIELGESLVLHGRETPLQFGSSTQFSLRRAGIDQEEPMPAPDLSSYATRDLFEAPDLDEAEQQLARMFSEGMTPTDLAITLHTASLGLRPEPGFFVRARGLLRGWPETAYELATPFREAPDRRTRELVLDLLVSADTAHAQEVILEVLAEQAEAGDPELPDLLQHVSLLRTPTAEMGQFVLALHAHGDERLRLGALYPMGALAQGLSGSQPELAERMLTTIRDALDRAASPAETKAALGGLGNGGRPDDALRALPHRAHPDRGVRAQVASTLRFATDPRATDALFEMLADPDRHVAASALDVLELYRPDDAALQQLAAVVIAGLVHPELDGPLVSVLARRGLEDDLSQQALAILRARSNDPRMRLRIARILGVDA